MSTIVLVEYIHKNGFTELNKQSLTDNNGNYGSIYSYHLTFPVDINDNVVTAMSKEQAEEMEEALGLLKGDLQFKSVVAKSQRFAFKKSTPTILDLSNLNDKLAYQCLVANSTTKNKLVALSDKDKTESTVLIVRDKLKENKEVLSKLELKQKAYIISGSLSSSDKRNILLFVGEKGTETIAEDAINLRIMSLIETEPKFFLELVEKSKDSIKVLIQEMLSNGVLKKNGENGRKILIEDTDDVLGVGVEEASIWFRNPDNSKEIIRLKNKLDNIKASK